MRCVTMQFVKRFRIAAGWAWVLLLFMSLGRAQSALSPVETESGNLIGTRDGAVRVFLGVPFAKPPVGDLRWRPAEPVERSSVPLPANRLEASCMQKLSRSHLPWTAEFMVQNEASEDCLYLNIWAPANMAASPARPVLVFLHGGGFVEGSGGVAAYDGKALAQRGLIVVTVNYRLGIFGYFADSALQKESPHASAGNYAMSDQIAALKWVQRNIGAFGGTPARVTLAGQSAGAESVAELLASPAAKGLFQRAVINSDPMLWPAGKVTPLPDAVAAGDAWASAGEQEKSSALLPLLRGLAPDVMMSMPDPPATSRRPDVDGWLLPEQPADDLRKPVGSDVPVILGWVADEGSATPGYGQITSDAYHAKVRSKYGARSAEFLKLYPAATDFQAGNSDKAAARDRNFAIAGLWAEAWAKQRKSLVYLYYFSRVPPWKEHPEFAAHHTSELPYFFGTLDKVHRDYTADDRAVSDAAMSAWVHFAESGAPGGGWTATHGEDGPVFDFGDTRTMRPMLDAERAAFWRSMLLPAPSP